MWISVTLCERKYLTYAGDCYVYKSFFTIDIMLRLCLYYEDRGIYHNNTMCLLVLLMHVYLTQHTHTHTHTHTHM